MQHARAAFIAAVICESISATFMFCGESSGEIFGESNVDEGGSVVFWTGMLLHLPGWVLAFILAVPWGSGAPPAMPLVWTIVVVVSFASWFGVWYRVCKAMTDWEHRRRKLL